MKSSEDVDANIIGWIIIIFLLELYRDIKGANLLVDSTGVVKLADFGMAKHVSSKIFPLNDRLLSLSLSQGEDGLHRFFACQLVIVFNIYFCTVENVLNKERALVAKYSN